MSEKITPSYKRTGIVPESMTVTDWIVIKLKEAYSMGVKGCHRVTFRSFDDQATIEVWPIGTPKERIAPVDTGLWSCGTEPMERVTREEPWMAPTIGATVKSIVDPILPSFVRRREITALGVTEWLTKCILEAEERGINGPYRVSVHDNRTMIEIWNMDPPFSRVPAPDWKRAETPSAQKTRRHDMELLPCPFCGGEAEQDWSRGYCTMPGGKLGQEVAVYCLSCNADMAHCVEDFPGVALDDLMAGLVLSWNNRHSAGHRYTCRAQKNSHPGDPQDCNWPICGCDHYAEKVIASLEEMGALDTRTTKPAEATEE